MQEDYVKSLLPTMANDYNKLCALFFHVFFSMKECEPPAVSITPHIRGYKLSKWKKYTIKLKISLDDQN